MRILKYSLLCLALVSTAACGSSSSPKTAAPTTAPPTTVGAAVTKAAYIARANAICTTMNRKVNAVPDPGNDPEKIAAGLTKVRSLIGDTVVQLRALPQPHGDEAQLSAIYAKVDALRAGMQAYIVALRARNAPAAAAASRHLNALGDAANSASNRYGLTVCGS